MKPFLQITLKPQKNEGFKPPIYMGYNTRKMKIVGSHESIKEIALTCPDKPTRTIA